MKTKPSRILGELLKCNKHTIYIYLEMQSSLFPNVLHVGQTHLISVQYFSNRRHIAVTLSVLVDCHNNIIDIDSHSWLFLFIHHYH